MISDNGGHVTASCDNDNGANVTTQPADTIDVMTVSCEHIMWPRQFPIFNVFCSFPHLRTEAPDRHQNFITCLYYYLGPIGEISSQWVHHLLSIDAYRQTDKPEETLQEAKQEAGLEAPEAQASLDCIWKPPHHYFRLPEAPGLQQWGTWLIMQKTKIAWMTELY